MKPSHQTFLLKFLAHGDKLKAYSAAYPTATGEAMRTSANRLLRHPHIAAKLAEVHTNAQQQLQQHIKDAAEKETTTLVSLHEKRMLLARMIRGQYKQVKHIRLKDSIQEVEADVTPSVLLRAIELDCKLASGKYKDITPPPKQEAKQPAIAPAQPPPPAPPTANPQPAPQPVASPAKPIHSFDYIPKHVTMIFPDEDGNLPVYEQAQTGGTPLTPSEENWELYLQLDANLRRTPAHLLTLKKASFEKLPSKQQLLILQPLIASWQVFRKTPAPPPSGIQKSHLLQGLGEIRVNP